MGRREEIGSNGYAPGVTERRSACRRALLAVFTSAALAGCGGAAGELQYESGRRARVSEDGLHSVKTWGGAAKHLYVRPGVDLKRYDQVMLEPVEMRFALNSPRTLAQHEVREVKASFQEIFEQEIAKSEVYTLVKQPGPRVLRATPHLVDIIVTAPARSATPDTQHIVESAGVVTLVLELSDSRSNAALVRAYDRRQVGSQGGLAYRDTAGADLARARLVFLQWAQRLRSWLDRVREIPPLPAEAAADAG